jgi:hypothetical protein
VTEKDRAPDGPADGPADGPGRDAEGAEDRREGGRPTPPSPDTVLSEHELRSPGGRTYRVIRTTQRDGYEEQGEAAPAEGADDDAAREDGGTAPDATA